ncbi:MAG: response regulator [Patescibacteria group bacterium]|jgi:DNA-binding response OmpR family regulator
MEKEKLKILLVEDDAFLARMYQSKLENQNFTVYAAGDGAEGIKLAQEKAPDVVLLDILLPKVDGWGVLKALKKEEKTKNIPVILLTNLGQKEDVDKGLAMGAVDYLIKAYFTPSEVVEKIKKVIK